MVRYKDRHIRRGSHGSYLINLPKATVEGLKNKIVAIEEMPNGEGLILRCESKVIINGE